MSTKSRLKILCTPFMLLQRFILHFFIVIFFFCLCVNQFTQNTINDLHPQQFFSSTIQPYSSPIFIESFHFQKRSFSIIEYNPASNDLSVKHLATLLEYQFGLNDHKSIATCFISTQFTSSYL